MRYDDISPTMRAFLGGYEGFRKLGFEPDELHCMVARGGDHGGEMLCFVRLITQDKEFLLAVGYVDDHEAFHVEYKRVVKAVVDHSLPGPDLDRIWLESEARNRSAEFVAAIVGKGIVIPIMKERQELIMAKAKAKKKTN